MSSKTKSLTGFVQLKWMSFKNNIIQISGLQNFSSIIYSEARSVLARHSDFLFKSYFSLKNVTSHAYIDTDSFTNPAYI